MRTRIDGAQGEAPLAALFSAALRSSRVQAPVRDRNGVLRRDYINGPALTADPGVLSAATELLLPTVAALQADAIVGVELGGCALASALALAADNPCLRTRLCFMRPVAKGHGYADRLSVPIPRGGSAVLVDDVISSGATAAEAVTYLRNLGIVVRAVVVLVNRHRSSGTGEAAVDVPVFYLLDSDIVPVARSIESSRPSP